MVTLQEEKDARKKRITDADPIQLCLVTKRKWKKRRYNLFRNGMIFPIRDLDGRSVVGYGKKPFSASSITRKENCVALSSTKVAGLHDDS